METIINTELKTDSVYHFDWKCAYLKDVYAKNKPESIVTMCKWMRKIGDYEKRYEKDLLEFSKEEIIQVLQDCKSNSNAYFAYNKRNISAYFRWCLEKGLMTKEQMAVLKKISYKDITSVSLYDECYFKDFNDLKMTIQQLIDEAYVVDKALFDVPKCIIFLAWFGLTNRQVCDLKKQHILTEENQVFIEEENRTVSMPRYVIDRLTALAQSDGFSSQARNVIFLHYRESEYLIRTKETEHVSEGFIRNALYRFNEFAADYGKRFAFDRIHWSGIFSRAAAWEQVHGDIEKGDKECMELLFQEQYENNALANKRLAEYWKYRKHFYQR